MKTRLVIVTSFITTVVVLMIVLVAFSVASPILAQSLPAQAPSLADAHLALPGGGGGGGQVWSVFGWDLDDLRSEQIHDMSLGGCRHYEAGSGYTTAMATVNIPTGATITWMRMLFNDQQTDPNVVVELRRYIGVSQDLPAPVTLSSIGLSGSGSVMASGLSIPVDNGSYMYMVHTDTGVMAGNMEICQIQIGYTLPNIFGAAMPLLGKE
jgi:hypothetical protein